MGGLRQALHAAFTQHPSPTKVKLQALHPHLHLLETHGVELLHPTLTLNAALTMSTHPPTHLTHPPTHPPT